ncbi:MAG: GTPase Era [Tissierellia bacterium]|nr:GTPase Era [Tissierellia bacterium]
MTFTSGFVSVVGRPNVGKSTLLNRIIGEKITIVSDKPQTTRNKIQLIYTDEHTQIIFLDTPGIQQPKNKLGTYMLSVSKSTLSDVDLILFLVEPGPVFGPMDTLILKLLEEIQTPVLLLLNKTDTIDETEQKRLLDAYRAHPRFLDVLPISALDGRGVEDFMQKTAALLPEGPRYYPDDMITDQPERFIVAEMIREKAILHLREEIPHGIVVEISSMRAREGKDFVDIEANVFVEKKSHKGMVIGKQGQMLKRIGTEARHDIERLLGSRVHLQLWVKVADKWRDESARLKEFGYK